MTTTRPYMQSTGDDLVVLINKGNKRAIAEGKHRSNRKVKAALAARTTPTPKKTTPKVTKTTPAVEKARNPRTEYANAQCASAGLAKGDPGWRTAFFAAFVAYLAEKVA